MTTHPFPPVSRHRPVPDDPPQRASLIEKWAIPILLIGIALNQFRLALDQDLSGWKGGGFGMFATIDAPSDRYLRCPAVDRNDEFVRIIPSFPGGSLNSELKRRLDCFPDAGRLQKAANAMLVSDYVSADSRERALLQKLATQNPEAKLSEPDTAPQAPVYRIRGARDPADSSPPIEIKRIGVEVWRIRFDPLTHSITGEVIAPRAEASRRF